MARKPNPAYKTLADWPLVITPEIYMDIFGVSKDTAYAEFNKKEFPSQRIGRKLHVIRDALARYMKVPEEAIPSNQKQAEVVPIPRRLA